MKAYEIGHCGKCGWKGDIEEADQRTKDELLYSYCPMGCEVEVAPRRPINASKDYFVNMFQRLFKEKKNGYEYDPGESGEDPDWLK
jgi:hypothetical protein